MARICASTNCYQVMPSAPSYSMVWESTGRVQAIEKPDDRGAGALSAKVRAGQGESGGGDDEQVHKLKLEEDGEN